MVVKREREVRMMEIKSGVCDGRRNELVIQQLPLSFRVGYSITVPSFRARASATGLAGQALCLGALQYQAFVPEPVQDV